MSHIAELAARYVAAYRANDDAAIAAVSLEIAPSDWTAVMQRVDAELPELAIKLDPERLAAAGARLGMDPALAAAVTEGLTADLATVPEQRRTIDGSDRRGIPRPGSLPPMPAMLGACASASSSSRTACSTRAA